MHLSSSESVMVLDATVTVTSNFAVPGSVPKPVVLMHETGVPLMAQVMLVASVMLLRVHNALHLPELSVKEELR